MINFAKRLAITLAVVAFAQISLPAVKAAGEVTPDDLARYLAGLPPSTGSELAPLTREPAWIRHADTLDKAWQRIEKQQLSRIRAWSKEHVPGHRELMLYMFSGPDFLYADAFYPHASTYVLSALEPVVPVPDVTKLSQRGRARALQELRGSMQSVLSFSFFITKEMKSDLRGGYIQGTVPLLYVFLARAGKTIREVEFIALNSDGSISRRNEAKKGAANGVKIVFSESGKGQRELYYFQTDLSNGGLKKSGFRAFCDRFGPADSLIKSASYLLHSGNFSLAREFLLRKSAVLLQDDSGIPLRFFDRDVWELHPFGRYLGPISLFSNRYQRDLARLFSQSRAQPIDFGIGYRWRRHRSNLMMAVKRPGSAAQ